MTDSRKIVKLFVLNGENQWDDCGIGYASCSYVERFKSMWLVVRDKSNNSLILESEIHPQTDYKMQSDSIILWLEDKSNRNLSLSFADSTNCNEIWDEICKAQRKDPSLNFQDITDESDNGNLNTTFTVETEPSNYLPPCELNRLLQINLVIGSCLPTEICRNAISLEIEKKNYIKKLLDIFHKCEDLEITNCLNYLHDIFTKIFLLNKIELLEMMFCDDDTIFDVVGCLEYNQKAKLEYKTHRNYLKNMSNFKEVIPISNPDLLSKIHQTYRMQYILDVVLPTPSITEKDMFSSLSSFIVFNKYDIIKIIQREDFLIPLFTQMKDESIGDEKLRDSIRFLKEYCTFSKSLSPETRHGFFKNLSVLGILEVLEITLGMDNQVIKSNSIDILSDIVEYSPSIVQEFILKQVDSSVDDDQLLINIMIEQMIYDADPESGRAVILMGLLKLLIDPGNMSCQSKFLNMFYQHSMHFLLAPVSANTTGANPSSEDNQTVQLIEWVLELLTFCVLHHRHHIRCYILRKDVLGRVLVLMKSKHKFLVLDALRFMRKIVGLKDDFYYRYMITGNLFLPVVDAFQRNNGRNNLLDSAIIEMFEFIKCQDIKLLCSHLVENFGECFDNVGYVKTFRELKTRYYQHQSKTLSVAGPSIVHQRYRREPREMDKEEETWFSHDDDSDDDMFGTSLQPVVNKYPITLLSRKIELVNFSSSKRTRRKIELVDYDDDDSDEEKDDFSPSKRTRFSK